MTVIQRRYDRKEFVDDSYQVFFNFMLDVFNSEGITLLVSDIEAENKVILTAYGTKVDVVRCADCGHSTLDSRYAEKNDPYCYWCSERDDYFKSTEYCSSGVKRRKTAGGADK